MKLLALASLLAAVTVSALPADSVATLEERQHTQTCASGVHVLAARGFNPNGGDHYGALLGLARQIVNRIPGSTISAVDYQSGNAVLPAGVYNGTQEMTMDIEQYVQDCPRARLVLLGYSYGAVVTMSTLCGTSSPGFIPTDPLPRRYVKNVLAAIVYGDESRVADQSYDRGTSETNAPLARLNPAACDPFAPAIRSYCDAVDPDCSIGGTNQTAHHSYFALYNTAATNFVVNRYNAL